MWRRLILGLTTVLLASAVILPAQKGHADDVITELPMPEIFLQPVKYVAHTGTTTVFLRTEPIFCVTSQGDPLSPCLIVPYVSDPNPSFVSLDLFTVVLPPKTVKETLSIVPRFGPQFVLINHRPDEHEGLFQARLTLTLESPAFPGGPVVTHFGDRRTSLFLAPGRAFSDTIHYTRDGLIGRQFLMRNLGLTAKQATAFFDNEITLRLGVRVRGTLLSHGSIFAGALIQGY